MSRVERAESGSAASGVIARYTCGCAVVRDFDGREYEQLALMCPGGEDHGRRIEEPTRESVHLWRPSLPFDAAKDDDGNDDEDDEDEDDEDEDDEDEDDEDEDDEDRARGGGRRTSYEDRVEARRARLERAAAKHRIEADARREASDRAVEGIPIGQPILVGHHSEGRHRRALDLSDRNMRKCIEHATRAKELERRASRVGSGGISSDDEDAIEKLTRKAEALRARRERLKTANRKIRAGVAEDELDLTDGDRKELGRLGGYSWERTQNGRSIFPAYVFRNLGSRIRQVEARLRDLRAAEAKREEAARVVAASGEGWTVTEDRDDNRILVEFDQKPEASVRVILKANGYRWSPTRSAWVRKLTDNARASVERLRTQIGASGV